ALQITGWQPPDSTYQPPGDAARLVTEQAPTLVRREPRLLRFAGPPGTIPSVSAAELIRSAEPAQALRGRVVFVGATAAGLGDIMSTPVTTNGAAMPGVEVLANALLNLRDDRFIVPLGTAWTLALSVALALVPLLWAARFLPLPGLLVNTAWFVALATLSVALRLVSGRWFAPS
ncbi:MAG: CHASE2 domain-containing protein, partial [Polaromonas sp.]|nr:CHASE2 domain-containing protein [Polaromonas sp.]